MPKPRLMLIGLLLVTVLLTLVSCGASSTTSTGDESGGLLGRARSFFGDLAERIKSVPVIGGWFARAVDNLAPDDQWCAGGIVSILVVMLLAAVIYFVRD